MRKQFILLALLAALIVSVLQADHFSHSVNVSALEFDGDGDWVTVPDDSSLRMGTENFTLEAWAKFEGDSVGVITRKATAALYMVGTAPDTDKLRWILNTTPADSVAFISSASVFDTQAWTHIAVSVDRGVAEVSTYVDGELLAVTSIAALGSDPINPESGLFIGATEGATAEWEGLIDEVRIWKGVARTQAQVNATKDKELIGNEAGLVGYWRFNEDGGSTAVDDSTNSNDGTITGATYITDDLPHLTDSQYHNLSPEDEVQPTAGEIPAMERRDTDARQRSLPLMGRIGDVEDSTGYPLVRLTLALMAGGFILFGAWFFSQLSPENPVVAWVFILIASLLAFGFGAIGWVSFICIALYSSGIVAFRQSTPA